LISRFEIKKTAMQVLSFDVGIRNLAFAVVEVNDADDVQCVRHWEVVDIVQDNGSRAKNARTIPLAKIVGYICGSLDKRGHIFERVQSVAIEQQPAGRGPVSNIKCKVLSHTIQAWALGRGISDVQFINPKMKTPGIKSYADRKKAAVDKVNTILEQPGFRQWRPWYDGLKKKDDAADCLLQMCAWKRPRGVQAPSSRKRCRSS